MDPKLARRLTAFYPPAWRARYGAEFSAFLEEYPANTSAVMNVVGSAIREHLRASGAFDMDARQRSLILMAYAYLAAVAAGVNFYWTIDDTPLAPAMYAHTALLSSFTLVERGSLAALLAVMVIAVPIVFGMLRDGLATGRWKAATHLAVPPGAAFIVFGWLVAGSMATGGHWVATPWDVTGDWPAPVEWPPLSVRWTMGSVTFALLVLGLLASARGVRQAIGQSDLSPHRLLLFKGTSIALAASIIAMTIGVGGWGWFAQAYAPADFHARNGGLFNSTNIASWMASCAVFIGASVLAVRGADCLWRVNSPSKRTT